MKADAIRFQLNGSEVAAAPGETIIEAAARNGVEIPHLCYTPGMRPDGNCRACMVEIKGERVLAPSCCRTPAPGMEVSSVSPRALHSQKIVVEMLAADVPERVYKPDSELAQWQRCLGIGRPRFAARAQPAADVSHPAMAVNLDACIQCTRCVRACREEQVNDVIGFAFRGAHSKIVFDLDDPMGESTCVACGECVQACPTGALAPAKDAYLAPVDKKVASVCPYCGVGCQLTYHVSDNTIVRVEGRDGPANHERLCVKGRFGFDYVHHPQRLTKPLIRKPGMPKSADFVMDPANPLAVFREASWDEALELAGGTLAKIRDAHGGGALAGFGSAKGSNEEAYLFQKLVRTGFGSNNVDHCTRLCHASSVAALLEGIGSGAVSNPVMDVMKAEVVLLIGANPVVNHPVAATWIKNAVKRGTKLILADPRRSELARHATHYLQFKPDTDVALLNAMMHTIVEEGLVAEAFINDRTSGYEELRKNVAGHSPEAMAPVCGIPAETIRDRRAPVRDIEGLDDPVGHGDFAARARNGQRAVPHRTLADDGAGRTARDGSASAARPEQRPGRERRRPHPDDVSGLSASGQCRRARHASRRCGARSLDTKPGLTVVEIMDAVHAGKIRGMYIMGENPAMSDPDVAHARQALAALEMLVVQDIFLTETAYLADVILPASAFPEKTGTFTNTDRLVQLGRQALYAAGRGAARPRDHRRHGEASSASTGATRIRARYSTRCAGRCRRSPASPGIASSASSAVTYPCEQEGDPGTRVVFTERFSDGFGPRPVRAGQGDPRRRAAGQRISVRAHHRAAARALAYGQHDAAHRSAGRDRAASGGVIAFARSRGDERRARRHDHGRLAARQHFASRARRRRHAARRGVHSLLLLRGGGESAHESGARSFRQDPGVQVLRGQGDRGRRRKRDARLRRESGRSDGVSCRRER